MPERGTRNWYREVGTVGAYWGALVLVRLVFSDADLTGAYLLAKSVVVKYDPPANVIIEPMLTLLLDVLRLALFELFLISVLWTVWGGYHLWRWANLDTGETAAQEVLTWEGRLSFGLSISTFALFGWFLFLA